MVGVKEDTELFEVARAIALEAEAISPDAGFGDIEPAFAALDSQLLAYSIGRDRVRTGSVAYDYPILMQAIEQVIAQDKALSANS